MLTLALSGSLWLSLAPSCSLLLSQAPYCSPNLRTTSSLGSQGTCSARSGAAALQHFMLLCLEEILLSIQMIIIITMIIQMMIIMNKSHEMAFSSDSFAHLEVF